MASELDLSGVMPRRVMTLFLLVDTSGSMTTNGNIGKVNSAIEEMIPLLQEVSDENADAEIKIAVLAFSSGCRWMTHDESGSAGAETLDKFFWNDLSANGLTDLGAACIELEKRLSRNEFLKSATGAYAPVIILLSDGMPTDDWEAGIGKLKHNNWYKAATKIAISVDEGDDKVMTAFTGTSESVLTVDSNRDDLKSLLCRLAVVSSTIASRSVSVGAEAAPEVKSEEIIKIVKETENLSASAPVEAEEDSNKDNEDDILGQWGEGW